MIEVNPFLSLIRLLTVLVNGHFHYLLIIDLFSTINENAPENQHPESVRSIYGNIEYRYAFCSKTLNGPVYLLKILCFFMAG